MKLKGLGEVFDLKKNVKDFFFKEKQYNETRTKIFFYVRIVILSLTYFLFVK